MRVLAGDIGGTNARLAVVEVEPASLRVLHARVFASAEHAGLDEIVRAFCAETGPAVERAAFGVAGPVQDGECRTPNLPWDVRRRELAAATGIADTALINDFRALGHALPLLGAADLVTLQAGEPDERGVRALIGAGTGLGQAFLIHDGQRYRVLPSEGGHASFAAGSELEWGLARWLAAEHGHVSWERVLSGPGLVGVYRYLASRPGARENPAVRAEMERGDAAAVITRHALEAGDALCQQALDVFVAAYGAQAGNLALTVLATGGVYLGGGIAPRILRKLEGGGFVRAFRHKGRLSELLARVPVHVIVNPEAGLLGAAAYAAYG